MKNRVEEFRNLVERGWVKEQIMSEMKVSERDLYRLASLAGVRPKTKKQMFIQSLLLSREPVSKIAQLLGTSEKFVYRVAKENHLALPEKAVSQESIEQTREPDILDQLEALVKKNYRSRRISRILGISRSVVNELIRENGFQRPPYRYWTLAENVSILIEDQDLQELSNVLGRTPNAIVQQRKKLKKAS